jgi:hypothetical protein
MTCDLFDRLTAELVTGESNPRFQLGNLIRGDSDGAVFENDARATAARAAVRLPSMPP